MSELVSEYIDVTEREIEREMETCELTPEKRGELVSE